MKKEYSLLIIGGPEGSTVGTVPGMTIDKIECDVAGILGHPRDKNFYSYDAVIYWPNSKCLKLPSTFEEWERKRSTSPQLPDVDRRYWTIRKDPDLYPQEVDWNASAMDGSSLLPISTADCDKLDSALRSQCADRLRDVIRGSAANLIAFAVVPWDPITPTSFSWISQFLVIRRCKESRVMLNRDNANSEFLYGALEKLLSEMMPQWPLTFDLYNNDPDNPASCMGQLPWGDHWYSDWDDEIATAGFESNLMHCGHAFRNGRNDGMSLMFRTVVSFITEVREQPGVQVLSQGFVLLMPPPRNLRQFAQYVADVLELHQGNEITVSKAKKVEAADAAKAAAWMTTIHEAVMDTNSKVSGIPLAVNDLQAIKENGMRHSVLLHDVQQSAQVLVKDVTAIAKNSDVIAKKGFELWKEHEELRQLHAAGYMNFVTTVEPSDFIVLAHILASGNQNKAARALNMSPTTLYDRVKEWANKGPAYKKMHRLVGWRKSVGGKTVVSLPESILGMESKDAHDNPETIKAVSLARDDKSGDISEILRDILNALRQLDKDNWREVSTELISIVKSELAE